MPKLRIGVCYDFRNPTTSGVRDHVLYGEILEQVKWLDELGADLVWFTEHHFVEDGYLPSWIPVAGAMAALTKHVRFGTNIALMPFNHPIRLAEDLAVLDNLSGGRVELGLGMGYAPHEFRSFGIPVKRRVSLMNEGIEVLQHCFSGERFSYHGKRYDFSDVKVTPGFVQADGPPLWIAAMSTGGAQRAAHYNTHYLPQGSKRKVYDPWVEAITARGRKVSDYRIGIIRSILVTDDKEKDWAMVRAAEHYRMELYKQFFKESGEGFGDPKEAIPQAWIVGDVDHCVAEIIRFINDFNITDITTMAVPPGLRAEQMAPSLERLFRDVVPRVKAHLGE
ncbi:MAG: alkanesulfonate monooxygenase SsuD [Gammaproteobacteria bacterium]|jgi:alkanesulfonate monooxygenase SsuD/methylene tetrahydromethanopterin reductase-like flavin-dependent oxidoreductase (luciferase family)